MMSEALALLARSRRPLLIAHPRPDGDTIGSSLALRLALLHLGAAPLLACVDPVPQTFAYLPGAEAFVSQLTDAQRAAVDLVVAVDISDAARAGGLLLPAPLLVIDHHETNPCFGDVNVVDHEAVATAQVLFPLLTGLGVEVTADIATCLLTGILTDTRGLRTSNVTPEVLALVMALVQAGGDYQQVVYAALDALSFQQMKAWGVALSRMEREGQLAWTTFPLEEKEALGFEDHDDLDLGNLLARVAEAEISATFLEMRDGTVKVSLRSRPGYDVARIARALGGGGHRNAAGCSVPGPLEAAVVQVLPRLRACFEVA